MKRTSLFLIPVALLLLILAVRQIDRGAVVTSDTVQLVEGAGVANRCLDSGQVPCGDEVHQWPLLQYIPAAALLRAGVSPQSTVDALGLLNAAAVVGVFALLWLVGRRLGGGLAAVLLLAALVSPLLWYGESGFVEAVAAFAVTAVVAGVLLEWPPAVIAVAALVAAISKDTAPPALIAVVALAALAGPRRAPRGVVLTALAGVFAGTLADVGFDLFRYGVPWNEGYLSGDWAMHGLGFRVNFTIAGLVAPNAGVLWFWPIATALIAAGAVGAAVQLRHAVERRALVAVGAAGLLVALLVSLAGWFGPFGWWAFGNRLVVPWIPAILLIAVAAWHEQLRAAIAHVFEARLRIAAAGAVAVTLGLGLFGAAVSPSQPFRLFDTPPTCPGVTPETLSRMLAGDERAHELHSRCLSRLAWRHGPILSDALYELNGARLPLAALFIAAVAGLGARACADSRSARGWSSVPSTVTLPAGL